MALPVTLPASVALIALAGGSAWYAAGRWDAYLRARQAHLSTAGEESVYTKDDADRMRAQFVGAAMLAVSVGLMAASTAMRFVFRAMVSGTAQDLQPMVVGVAAGVPDEAVGQGDLFRRLLGRVTRFSYGGDAYRETMAPFDVAEKIRTAIGAPWRYSLDDLLPYLDDGNALIARRIPLREASSAFWDDIVARHQFGSLWFATSSDDLIVINSRALNLLDRVSGGYGNPAYAFGYEPAYLTPVESMLTSDGLWYVSSPGSEMLRFTGFHRPMYISTP